MRNPDRFVENLTPYERLENLLSQIKEEIDFGDLSAACEGLREIQLNRIQKYPDLYERYVNLETYCPK
jgi:hypothetical protein